MEEMTKTDMFYFLSDVVGLGEETMNIIVKVMGDSKETYKRVLTKTTDFRTFDEAIDYYTIQD